MLPESLQIRCHASLWIPVDQQISDDRHGCRSGLQNRRCCLERDSTNRNNRNRSGQPCRSRDETEPDGRVTGVLRRGTEDRPDGKVGDRLAECRVDLRDGVGRESNDCRRAEQPTGISRREILLTDMNARRFGQRSQVCAVVHDDRRLVRHRGLNERVAEVEKRTGRHMFGAKLEKPGATVQI